MVHVFHYNKNKQQQQKKLAAISPHEIHDICYLDQSRRRLLAEGLEKP